MTQQQGKYAEYTQKEKDRLMKGLPPLGKRNGVPNLELVNDPALKPVIHPEGHEFIESKVGNVRLKSYCPEHPYYVLFRDDGEVGYFFVAADLEEGPRILDSLQIYNTQELSDKDKTHLFEIIWDEDSLKAALLINKHFHAVYDLENYHACCRTSFPPVDPNSSFGMFSHEWSDEMIRCFLKK